MLLKHFFVSKISHSLLPPDRDIVLVTDDYEKALEANTWARRVCVNPHGSRFFTNCSESKKQLVSI